MSREEQQRIDRKQAEKRDQARAEDTGRADQAGRDKSESKPADDPEEPRTNAQADNSEVQGKEGAPEKPTAEKEEAAPSGKLSLHR